MRCLMWTPPYQTHTPLVTLGHFMRHLIKELPLPLSLGQKGTLILYIISTYSKGRKREVSSSLLQIC